MCHRKERDYVIVYHVNSHSVMHATTLSYSQSRGNLNLRLASFARAPLLGQYSTDIYLKQRWLGLLTPLNLLQFKDRIRYLSATGTYHAIF